MTYEAAFAIASVFISLQIALNFLKYNKVSNIQGRLFLALVIDNGVTGVAVTARWVFLTYLHPAPVWLLELMGYIYFITHIMLIVLMFLYILSTVRIWREVPVWIRLLILLPVCSEGLVLLTNPLTHLIYYNSPDGLYHRGPWILSVYAVSAYYVLLIFFILLWFRRSFSAKRIAIILLIMGMAIASTLVQFFIPEMTLEVCTASICALIFYLFIQNPSEQIDPELDILSRAAFTERMKYNLLARKRFDLVELLLPDLMEYERRYGSEKAQMLLSTIVEWLSGLGDNINLYHYDKNSFALEVISPHAGEVGGIIRAIRKRFDDAWEVDGEMRAVPSRMLRLILPTEMQDEQVLYGVMNRFAMNCNNELRVMTAADFDLENIKRNREINGALARAMEKNNFEMRYTPIYSPALERIVAAEVSLRFFDDELGYVYDDELFRFAEQSGHVLQLGELIVERTCRFIHEEKLQEQGLSFLAIRLHPAMCLQYRLMDRLKEIVGKYDIPSNMLCLMLSEYTVSTATSAFREGLSKLEDTGVRFCLEDYGSGFTSITSIFEMPFSVLKINQSVIRAALSIEKARITMDATLQMARDLNMMTMVEGIEDERYFDMIKNMACDLAKGNYFFEQLVKEEFLRVIHLRADEEGEIL